MFKMRKKIVVYMMGLFLVLFLAEGCSKNVPVPEPVAEPGSIPAPVGEEQIADRVFGEQEPGFDTGADTSFRESEFITESGAAPEEPGPIEEMAGEVVDPVFGVSGGRDFGDPNAGPMEMGSNAFSAEPMEEVVELTPEPEPVMEAIPMSEPEPVREVRLFEPTPEIQLEDIHFAFDQYDLDESSKQTLRLNANVLRDNPEVIVEIQGHCDERGTNNYNLGLGERRVTSTKSFLVALGIENHRLNTISYGEEKPFCSDSNDDCWRQNRRSHFMIRE